MNKDTRGQRARRAHRGARRAWVLLNAARGTAHSQQARLGEDDEGRHGSSKWCSPSTPCQLLGEARREIWHGSVLSTEGIIGKEASSPATSGVLQPEKFWSSAARMGREGGVSGKSGSAPQTCWWGRIVTEEWKGREHEHAENLAVEIWFLGACKCYNIKEKMRVLFAWLFLFTCHQLLHFKKQNPNVPLITSLQ